jgi:hypothetical protein
MVRFPVCQKFNRPGKQWILSGFFAQCLCIDSKVNKNERKITIPLQFIKSLSWELEEHGGGDDIFCLPIIGTPTKRQVLKRQVSKRLVSKRTVFKYDVLIKQKV